MTRFIFVFTLLAAALVAHQAWLWTHGIPIETDILSLLPPDERDSAADEVLRHLSDEAQRTVVVLVSGPTKDATLAGAKAFKEAVQSEKLAALPLPTSELNDLPKLLERYQEYLLTPKQLERLQRATPDELAQQAMVLLQQPMGARFSSFRADPLQLYPEYLRELAQGTKLRPEGEFLYMQGEAEHHVLLRFVMQGGSAFSLDGTPRLRNALDAAEQTLPAGVKAVSAGVPLFAEAAATQANKEVSTVGLGSLAAILVVMILAFRSLRPLILVTLSVLMGVAAGLSVCVLVFGKVHLMTLVFGASLVGVAEDYGIHYFASRQSRPGEPPRKLLNHLTPGLFLATLTSVAGYVMLALAPFPGLRQVAVFSAAGLTAAFLTVIAWFPTFDRGTVKPTRFSQVWAGTLKRWPRLSLRGVLLLTAGCAVVIAAGLWKLSLQDDVRALQASPPALIQAQRVIAERIGLPSPAQFFLVRGATEAERLEHEEALTAKLDALIGQHHLAGYDAVTKLVSSPKEQLRRREVFRAARQQVLDALKDDLDDATPIESSQPPMTVKDAMSSPMAVALTPLWLPDVSVVLLHSPEAASLPLLAELSSLPGVHFVDRTGDISRIMQRWRVGMSELLVAGYVVIYIALFVRFRKRAWQALLPTLLCSGLTLAFLGFIGEPITLFHVLSLFLLLGMGVDYGIFMVEHPSDGGEAWLAIGLGAVSTLLSFGLLAVSTTPAIHAFGMTLGLGIFLVWLMSPLTKSPLPGGGEGQGEGKSPPAPPAPPA